MLCYGAIEIVIFIIIITEPTNHQIENIVQIKDDEKKDPSVENEDTEEQKKTGRDNKDKSIEFKGRERKPL